MFRTRRTATTVNIRYPMTTGTPDGLELEDARVVLVLRVFVGDQLDVTSRLRTSQWRAWSLPDERPVVRITHPQRCRSRLVTQLSMPLALRMRACIHAGRLVPTVRAAVFA